MDNISCCSYFNPCSKDFNSYKFCELSCCNKFTTIFCAVIGLVGCGIGALATYRLCLKKLSEKKVTTPTFTSATQAQQSPNVITVAPRAPIPTLQIGVGALQEGSPFSPRHNLTDMPLDD